MVLLGLWLLASPILAAEQRGPEQTSSQQVEPKKPAAEAKSRPVATRPVSRVRYVAPRRGSPRTKVGAGVRGYTTQPKPLALAPPHTALSAGTTPTFFWFIDDAMQPGAHAVFTLTRADRIDPVAEIELGTLLPRGIQRVDLAEHAVELEADVEYQWAIAIVIDRDGRGVDRVDRSYVMHVATEEPGDSAEAWAARSYWHDALASAMAAVDAAPESASARADLAALLTQGGLAAAIP